GAVRPHRLSGRCGECVEMAVEVGDEDFAVTDDRWELEERVPVERPDAPERRPQLYVSDGAVASLVEAIGWPGKVGARERWRTLVWDVLRRRRADDRRCRFAQHLEIDDRQRDDDQKTEAYCGEGSLHGVVSCAQRLSSICETCGQSAEPPKFITPA